jgi:hypothetical protein
MPFIVRRVIFYIVAAWVALTINFFIPRAMPGNAVESIMSKFPNLQPSAYQALQAMLGVGHPGSLWDQYRAYLVNVFHFNFGVDVTNYPARVSTLLGQTIPWTITLVGTATVIAFLAGTVLGIVAGWRHGGWLDRVRRAGRAGRIPDGGRADRRAHANREVRRGEPARHPDHHGVGLVRVQLTALGRLADAVEPLRVRTTLRQQQQRRHWHRRGRHPAPEPSLTPQRGCPADPARQGGPPPGDRGRATPQRFVIPVRRLDQP